MPLLNNLNTKQFAADIEDIVRRERINYIDAIVAYCQRNDIEIETISQYINSNLKSKIQQSAQELHLIQKTAQLKFK